MKNRILLTDIDSILDTRLSVLHKEFGDKILDILPTYNNRILDSFPPLINNKDFLELYKQRDKGILKDAIKTESFNLLRAFVNKVIAEMVSNPLPSPPKIILNVYPYELTIEEKKLFLNLIIKFVTEYADVEIIDKPDHEITPTYLNEEVELFIKYDYSNWLEEQAANNNFKNVQCPDVVMFSPSILNMDKEKLYELLNDEASKDASPFEAIRLVCLNLIDLQFIKTSMFSYNTSKF